MSNVECRSKQLLSDTCIFGDVGRFEQAGDERDAPRAGRDDLLEVLDLYSADAKDRQRDSDMHAVDLVQTDWLIIGFGGGCKNRAETDVIGAFALRRECLLKAVRRFPNQQSASRLFPGHSNRIVI